MPKRSRQLVDPSSLEISDARAPDHAGFGGIPHPRNDGRSGNQTPAAKGGRLVRKAVAPIVNGLNGYPAGMTGGPMPNEAEVESWGS